MFIFMKDNPQPKVDYVAEISKRLLKMTGRYSYAVVFTNWVEIMAISISNSCNFFHDSIWKAREEKYKSLIERYTNDELVEMSNLLGMLTLAFESKFDDYLGKIFMESDVKSARNGQFFTPYHLSSFNAKMLISKAEIPEGEKLKLSEPSCGSGGMIIAAAEHLRDKGINYQRKMKVVAQDLDWTAVYMCYVQLSIIGVNAVVLQGNTLAHRSLDEYTEEHRLYTPNARGMLI